MIKQIFYYQTGRVGAPLPTKVLTTEQPVSQEHLQDLAWDFGCRLTPPRVEVTPVLSLSEKADARAKITTAARGHKNLKAKFGQIYKENRDEIVRALLASKTPRWGSIRVNFTTNGL